MSGEARDPRTVYLNQGPEAERDFTEGGVRVELVKRIGWIDYRWTRVISRREMLQMGGNYEEVRQAVHIWVDKGLEEIMQVLVASPGRATIHEPAEAPE